MMKWISLTALLVFCFCLPTHSHAAIKNRKGIPYFPDQDFRSHGETLAPVKQRFSPPIFDFPVTYNHQVRKWIKYFQTTGKSSFKRWLERSARYAPYIQNQLEEHQLPQDLLYVAMIESGFVNQAHSPAGAVGIWQFVAPTARRYGLKVNWWIDERRNFTKATKAAIKYKKDLYKMFRSWHLVSASYNTGENRIYRLIKRHGTNNFWEMAEMKVLPNETINYVPKIIAATLIAKSPALYGFRDLNYKVPYKFEETYVPGGTDLNNLAQYIGVKKRYLKDLNPDLIRGFVPREINKHLIKVPVGSKSLVKQYAKLITNKTI
ncbi:MAG: lytic transglycosylase domain-containing protein [Bdellovibrionales bacterium]|nr:lytic transglycosylase domain-containing protein [Bdellovibrionales bacterium]